MWVDFTHLSKKLAFVVAEFEYWGGGGGEGGVQGGLRVWDVGMVVFVVWGGGGGR